MLQIIIPRTLQEVANQGFRICFTSPDNGISTGTTVIQPGTSNKVFVVSGFVLSTSSATPLQVTLSFQDATTSDVLPFFKGFVTNTAPLSYGFQLGDERYSGPGDTLLIKTTGTTAYTVNARVITVLVA